MSTEPESKPGGERLAQSIHQIADRGPLLRNVVIRTHYGAEYLAPVEFALHPPQQAREEKSEMKSIIRIVIAAMLLALSACATAPTKPLKKSASPRDVFPYEIYEK